MNGLRDTFIKMFDKEPTDGELFNLMEILKKYQQVIEECDTTGAISADDYIALNGGEIDISYFDDEDGGDV